MTYTELVEMWNAEYDPPWSDIGEDKKIEFAFSEGRIVGLIEIAEIARKLSEGE